MPFFPVIALIAAAVGVLIGAVGIGGVALPPALAWLVGLDPHTAAGTSTWSFLFTGLAGTAMYARGAIVPWRLVGRLTVGVVPAALIGAAGNHAVPDRVAMLPLAALVTVAGVHSLLSGRSRAPRGESGARDAASAVRPAAFASSAHDTPRPAAAIAIGAVVGFCSALTGTGGPVVLMPILLAARIPAIQAVAASQVVQIPLVVFAVLGYASRGAVDFGAGTLIGVVAAVGAVAGAAIAMRMPQRALRHLASLALVGFGAALVVLTLVGPPPG